MADLVDDVPIVSRECPAAIFVNLVAGRGRALSILPQLENIFEQLKFPVEFFASNTTDEMQTHVRVAIANGRELLVAMGGDGTVQELVNLAFDKNRTIGILPIGGGNDFATALKIPKNPADAAYVLAKGCARLVDIVRARTADGRERFYVGGGGLGLDAAATHYANGVFHRVPGRLRYVASALRALRNFKSIEVRVEFPGSNLPNVETRALVAAALNTRSYGAGVYLAPEATPDDGTLNIVLVEDLRAVEVMKLLPRLVFRGELHTSRVRRFQAKRVMLSTDSPCMFHGDGELLGPAPVEIEIVPRSIRVIAPRLSGTSTA